MFRVQRFTVQGYFSSADIARRIVRRRYGGMKPRMAVQTRPALSYTPWNSVHGRIIYCRHLQLERQYWTGQSKAKKGYSDQSPCHKIVCWFLSPTCHLRVQIHTAKSSHFLELIKPLVKEQFWKFSVRFILKERKQWKSGSNEKTYSSGFWSSAGRQSCWLFCHPFW